METLEQQFDSRVRVFLGRTGLSPTTFGMKALGDPNLMHQIDGGRSLSLRTADRVLGVRGGTTTWTRAALGLRPEATGAGSLRHGRGERGGAGAMSEQPIEQRTNPPTRFLRRPEVTARTGLARSTIQVRLAEGRFPRPVSLGSRAVGWIEAEVDEWIRERIAESRDTESAAH